MKYSLKATDLCGKFTDFNPLLAASIYSDLAEVYRTENQLDEAYKYLSLAGKIISDKKLPFGYDVFAIERKCAKLLESMGKYFEAFLFINTILVQIKDRKDNPLDLANVLWDGGFILLKMNQREKAQNYLGSAYKIYSDLRADDTKFMDEIEIKLLQNKIIPLPLLKKFNLSLEDFKK
ncbi:MAG: hypothetical protein LUG66_08695 [Clostridiales bacterium]|nr:hypothetical protein [Clostridiales bacterium]